MIPPAIRHASFLVVLTLAAVAPGHAASSLQFYSLTPCRIVDTRGPNGPTGGPALQQGPIRNFPITNYCNVPSTAKAAMLNIAMVGPTADGFVTVWQYSTPWPGVTNLNALAGEPALANGACVSLAGGSSDISATYGGVNPAATTHLIVDVTGYFQ